MTLMEGSSSTRYPNKIRQLRMEKGLTQQELAFVLDYESVSSLSRLEAGRKLPTLETALKLEVAFQRLVPDIFPELYDKVRNLVGKRRVEMFQRKEKQRKT